MANPLTTALDALKGLAQQVEASGDVAEKGTRLELVPHSQSGKMYARKRTGGKFEGCGPMGGERHKTALLSVQRREVLTQLAKLTQKIEALMGDEAMGALMAGLSAVAIPKIELAQADVLSSAPVAKVSRQKAANVKKPKKLRVFSLLKTRRGVLIHAVAGRMPLGQWRKAALCGVVPPEKGLGWDVPTVVDGVSCPKCLKKLPADYERHFPELL